MDDSAGIIAMVKLWGVIFLKLSKVGINVSGRVCANCEWRYQFSVLARGDVTGGGWRGAKALHRQVTSVEASGTTLRLHHLFTDQTS